MSRLGMSAFALAVLVGAPPAFAQDDKKAPQEAGDAANFMDDAPKAKPKGEYGGVRSNREGGKNLAAADRACRRKRSGTTVKWVGFQRREGKQARAFVQMCAEAAYEQTVEGKTLLVTVTDAAFASKNTTRRMDLRFFGTRLAYLKSAPMRLKKKGKRGIQIVVEFQRAEDATQATASLTTEKDGYTYIYLDFAAPGGVLPTPELQKTSDDGEAAPAAAPKAAKGN